MSTEYYLEYGKVSEVDSNEAYAKKQLIKGRTTYFIKRATAGPECPHLLNPWGIHFQKGVDNVKWERLLGKHRFEYSVVPEEAFNLYIRFLATGNTLYYRQSERALD